VRRVRPPAPHATQTRRYPSLFGSSATKRQHRGCRRQWGIRRVVGHPACAADVERGLPRWPAGQVALPPPSQLRYVLSFGPALPEQIISPIQAPKNGANIYKRIVAARSRAEGHPALTAALSLAARAAPDGGAHADAGASIWGR
jgi:hypothetical protein